MLVITSCSSTKRAPAAAALKASNYRTPHLGLFAELWVRHIRAEPERHEAHALYGGASVAAATTAAKTLGGRLYFVSAGMSLISSTAKIPSYDLTVSAQSASLPPPMRDGSVSAAQWWSALNGAMARSNPFARVLHAVDGLVILALPRAYLRMVEPDLLGLKVDALKRLRIITVGEVQLTSKLLDQVVSYDARMEQLPGVPGGTGSSAVQRALLDFSQRLARNPTTLSIHRQRQWIAAALGDLKFKPRPSRKAIDDAAIARWILRRDPKRAESASGLLRQFRDAGLACEQRRFARIARSTTPSQ